MDLILAHLLPLIGTIIKSAERITELKIKNSESWDGKVRILGF